MVHDVYILLPKPRVELESVIAVLLSQEPPCCYSPLDNLFVKLILMKFWIP